MILPSRSWCQGVVLPQEDLTGGPGEAAFPGDVPMVVHEAQRWFCYTVGLEIIPASLMSTSCWESQSENRQWFGWEGT